MEQVASKVLPKDLTALMKRALYVKFFSLIILNNLFWIFLSSMSHQEAIPNKTSYPANYNTLAIKTRLMIDMNSKTTFALLTEDKLVLSKDVKLLEELKKNDQELESNFNYLIAVPQEDYLRIVSYLDQHLNLIPHPSLKFLKNHQISEPSYEINF
jgi:hypothetical protein